jgi:uncharacterized membrane protein
LGVGIEIVAGEKLMQGWLTTITEYTAIFTNAMAVFIIAYGTIEAFIRILRNLFGPPRTHHEFRLLYLRYARFLVGGLTFQLAADVIETAIAPGWEEIGHLAAIAAIRTFLSFFLERDMLEVRDAERVQGKGSGPSDG